MEAIARVKNLRGSARKARLVLDLIRGKKVTEAKKILAFSRQRMASNIQKLLDSAVANAIDKNEKAEIDNMSVNLAYADDGRILRRFRARAQGRATVIRRRTCHITIGISQK